MPHHRSIISYHTIPYANILFYHGILLPWRTLFDPWVCYNQQDVYVMLLLSYLLGRHKERPLNHMEMEMEMKIIKTENSCHTAKEYVT